MNGDDREWRERLERQAVELHAAGRLSEALVLFEQVATLALGDPRSLVNLGYLRFRLGRHADAEAAYREALSLDPRHVQAHHGMSAVLAARGDREGSERHLITACRLAPIRTGTFRGHGTPVRVLELLAAGAGNLNAKPLLDDRTFLVTEFFVNCIDATTELPPHDVIFNAIGDADASAPALHRAAAFAARSAAKTFNAVSAVLQTTRGSNARRLATIPGIRTPRTVRVSKRGLRRDKRLLERFGMRFPLLLRSLGFHNGEHFELVENATELAAAVLRLPGNELYAIEYLDVRSKDGKVRKYRAIFVDGGVFPLHAAISHAWKVHYVTADMVEVAEHRAEDERFLNGMNEVLGERAVEALHRIREALGLDYAGIDFSIDGNGDVVLFEANATMLVPPVPEDLRWSYRREPTRRIVERFARMLGGISA